MKIIALVHGYPPNHNAGAEWMLHDMLKHAVSKGHKAEVLLPISELKPYTIDGVKVDRDVFQEARAKVEKCDLLLTHLDRHGKALNIAEYYNKPIVLIVHNTHRYGVFANKWNREGDNFAYVLYNSEYTATQNKYPNRGVIVRPPVDPARCKAKSKGDKITLINLFEPKGGLVLQSIAKQMKKHKFLGVKGGYGKQEIGTMKNITYIENTSDIKSVYSQTRVLLMPSSYESYGRVAVEAMINGIPVIAHPTPGLKESLGSAGIFADRNNVAEWVTAIELLDDPDTYAKQSELCLQRAKEIEAQTKKELDDMLNFFNSII